MKGQARRLLHAVPGALGLWRRYLAARRKAWLRRFVRDKARFKAIDFAADRLDLRLNIGAGNWYLRHWYVMDVPPGARPTYEPTLIDFPFDLCTFERLPFEDATVRFIYTSHTFEHIPQAYMPHLFREAHRVLKPGGVIRVTTPDYDLAADAYERRDHDFYTRKCSRDGVRPYEYHNFQRVCPEEFIDRAFIYYFATSLATTLPIDEIRAYRPQDRIAFADRIIDRIKPESQGVAAGSIGDHVNWFTTPKMISLMKDAGFSEAYESSIQQSRFPEMRNATHAPREPFDHAFVAISLYVEGVK